LPLTTAIWRWSPKNGAPPPLGMTAPIVRSSSTRMLAVS